MITRLNIALDDEGDQKELLSSLRKLLDKNKKVGNLEKTLAKVVEKLYKIVIVKVTNHNSQLSIEELVRHFDKGLITL